MRICHLFLLCFLLIQCTNTEFPDLIMVGQIYTVDSLHKTEAFAVQDGKIIKVGESESILKLAGPNTEVIETPGTVLPGFIEGHGHFEGLGKSRIELNLLNTSSWEEIEELVIQETDKPKGHWIIGRGWHQDKWDSIPKKQFDGYPYHNKISSLTQDHPMILIHASGHSLYANERAMIEVGITGENPHPLGGRNVKDDQGNLIGVFEETAMRPFNEAYNDFQATLSAQEDSLRDAEIIKEAVQACVENGVTTFQDAGSKAELIKVYYELAKNGKLDIRLWVMLRDSYDQMKKVLSDLPVKERLEYFYLNAIKSEIDGALGSYGAWLLEPYFDKPGFEGQNTTTLSELVKIADLCRENEMQLCVHAIGDRANRVVLDMMESRIQDRSNHRWRIEHAQHLDPKDIPRFAELGIIASMQSVHCTSDAAFVEKRLGEERARRGAYVWKSLINSGAMISNGTDTPVEDISPFDNFYSAVTRKYQSGATAFFNEQCMTRKQALESMTINAAYAGFEEHLKGSISTGKYADFIILDQDIMMCPEDKIKSTRVLSTYVGGKLVYTATES